MSPRKYTKTRRAALKRETRQRILDAVINLHAEHGALGTSYAMIADRAGVSLQTVYNHFPDLGILVKACTGHVTAQAPEVSQASFHLGETAADRLELLTRAVYENLEYLSPWLRLGFAEAAVVPELDELFTQQRNELRKLIRQAVAPEFKATSAFLDAATVLLDYPAWKSFRHRRSAPNSVTLASCCLTALLPALANG